MCRSIAFVYLLAAILLAHVGPLNAQVPPQGFNQNLNAQNLTTVELDGELKGAKGNYIQIQQASGTLAVVQLPQEPGATLFEADVKPTQLNPTMLVRFTLPYEELQKSSISPAAMVVFSLVDVSKMKPRNDRERADYVPGMYPLAQLGNDPNSKDVQVVARVVGVKDKMLIVNAGRPLQIDLSDETTLKFNSNSLQLAKPGDKVKGSGITRDPQAAQIAATRVVISGTIPEGEQVAAEEKSNKSKRRGKKSKTEAVNEDAKDEGESVPQEK